MVGRLYGVANQDSPSFGEIRLMSHTLVEYLFLSTAIPPAPTFCVTGRFVTVYPYKISRIKLRPTRTVLHKPPMSLPKDLKLAIIGLGYRHSLTLTPPCRANLLATKRRPAIADFCH